MRFPLLASLLLVLLCACRAGEQSAAPEKPAMDARLRRGLVSVSEDELPGYALDWRAPAADIAEDRDDEVLARAEAARAAGQLYENAGDAIPLLLALARRSPENPQLSGHLQAAMTQLLAQGDQALAALGESSADMAAVHRIAAVARTVAGEAPETLAFLDRVDAADRLQALLEHGEHELAAGHLGESSLGALTAFREVLRARPGDVRALQGLAAVEQALLARAQQAAGEDDYIAAEQWLSHAARVRPELPWVVDEARRRLRLQREARVAGLYAQTLRTLDRPHEFGALKLARSQIAEFVGIAAQGDWRVARLHQRLELASRYGRHRPGQRFSDALASGGYGPPMVVLPHGQFMMGATAEDKDAVKAEWPQHQVRFQRGFALARTETTVADFARFVRATGYRSRAERRGYSVVYDERSGNFVLRNDIHWRHDYLGRIAAPNMPVLHVSVQDAERYAHWLSDETGHRYRLPHEAEFEYALRSGKNALFPWGEGEPPPQTGNLTGSLDKSASGRRWGNAFAGYGDGHWGPAPAGSFRANAFGLHDLEGNLSEWTMDCWHVGYRRAPADGGAWYNPGCRTRVVRGASWSSAPSQARAAWRMSQAHDVTNARTGFRVVRDI
ncbi:MAG: formylglycine-generating enzyme family protein [Pseudomonadota bacterium]|nr:formylglycine-generating enzyme family protein [Pseudomonadota bacterium]